MVYLWRRLKNENETRKHEIHGLKDILVRENDNRIRETEELRAAMELSTQELVDGIEKAKSESKKQVKTLEKELEETMLKDKKIMSEKLENTSNDLKKKIEMETNEIRYFLLQLQNHGVWKSKKKSHFVTASEASYVYYSSCLKSLLKKPK